MLQVSWGDYWKASDRWDTVVGGTYDNHRSFHTFLGCNSIIGLDDLATERIRLLNGPHYRAIIKAYLARTNHV